jgi:hypothetical protein
VNSALDDKRLLNLVNEFSDTDWGIVYKSKDTLESLEDKSLPYLFDLLTKDNEFVKLSNTADLIYPGAIEFYGHGWVVDYDLDWLAIRTGWAIEEIAFQDFGFKENKITEQTLMQIERDSTLYKRYLETGTYDFKISPEANGRLKETKTKAMKWWNENRNSWTRLKGIQEAIESSDTIRLVNALQYLRFGEHCISGLDREYFTQKIEPIIKELLKSTSHDISSDAKLILEDVHDDSSDFFSHLRHKCWTANVLQQKL